MHAVGIGEIGHEMVVNVAVDFRARPPRRAAAGYHFRRMRAHDPVADIDVVQVLLNHLIAANPDEGIPGAVLPFHVAPLGVAALLLDDRTSHPIGITGGDIADRSAFEPVHGLNVIAGEAALGTGHNRELELFGFFRRGHEAPHAGRVRAERLFTEYVLFGGNRGFKELRPVTGRGRQHDDVYVRADYFLIGVEADEAVLGVHLNAARNGVITM